MALLERVNELQAKAEKKPHNRNIILELQAEKLRLKRIMTYKTKGAILRSKVRWHEQGERNTKYFYGLEKRNFNNKAITRLIKGSLSSSWMNSPIPSLLLPLWQNVSLCELLV